METLWIAGFARSLSLKNLLFPIKLISSLFKSFRIVKKFKPDVAIGTGGYVTGPILFIASKLGIPVLIQEQDAYPGVTTRLLGKYANQICIAFVAAKDHLEQFANKTSITGNPIRKGVLEGNKLKAAEKWALSSEKTTVFIFGGSQGARSINLAMVKILPSLMNKQDFQVLWQTGERQYQPTLSEIGDINTNVKIIPYVDDMGAAYQLADIIVCRAGASSLAELALVAKSAILVPYPYAAGDHQKHNAQAMVDSGAAQMVMENEGWENQLKTALIKVLADKELRNKQQKAWQKVAKPNASEKIAKIAIGLMENENKTQAIING